MIKKEVNMIINIFVLIFFLISVIFTIKYKFTKATDTMKSYGLITPYDSTEEFIAQLSKHLKIIKNYFCAAIAAFSIACLHSLKSIP